MNLVQALSVPGKIYKPSNSDANKNGTRFILSSGNPFSFCLIDIQKESGKIISISEIRPDDFNYTGWLSIQYETVNEGLFLALDSTVLQTKTVT